jgi:hypothetical protein
MVIMDKELQKYLQAENLRSSAGLSLRQERGEELQSMAGVNVLMELP